MPGRPFSPEDKARLEALAQMPDEDIDYSDIPETTEEDWKDAVRGWLPLEKRMVTLALDAEVYEWIEQQGSANARTINFVLRRELQRQARTNARQETASEKSEPMSKAS